MRSPATLELMACPPTVAFAEHPSTEHWAGQGLLAKLTQCCAQDPHAQFLSDVPPLLDHAVAGTLMLFSSSMLVKKGLTLRVSGEWRRREAPT